jgi:hypothetical protein
MFSLSSHRRKMTAITFPQTADKNIFESKSSLFVVNNDSAFITATQSLRRTACPTTVRRRIKKTNCNQERKGRLPIAARCLFNYSVMQLFDQSRADGISNGPRYATRGPIRHARLRLVFRDDQ